MNSAVLENDKLYITSETYSSFRGRYMDTTVVEVSDIDCIKAKVGKQGGMHTWAIKDKEDNDLYYGDRKDSDLIEQITKLMPKIKYHKKVEGGGAPWQFSTGGFNFV